MNTQLLRADYLLAKSSNPSELLTRLKALAKFLSELDQDADTAPLNDAAAALAQLIDNKNGEACFFPFFFFFFVGYFFLPPFSTTHVVDSSYCLLLFV